MVSPDASKSSYTSIPHLETSWLQQVILSTKIIFARFIAGTWVAYLQYKTKPPRPGEVRSFPSHPYLKNRIFQPPNKTSDGPPPLFLDIHGGGFILFNPSIDDAFNTQLAKDLNCLVISLDYSKAPRAKFPIATNELIDTILDILADDSLIFDRSRVVLGGHSAGGNLTISCAQSPRLQGKLAGVLPWFPATDFSDDHTVKASLRPYDVVGEVDPLLHQIIGIRYAYVKPGQDLRDPRLSTVFADRAMLPKHIMIVGAENDMLAHEAWRQARRYVGLDDGVDWEDDQVAKYGFEDEKKGVRFLLMKGAKHGYTHFMGGTGVQEERRRKQARESEMEVKAWLERGPFAVAAGK